MGIKEKKHNIVINTPKKVKSFNFLAFLFCGTYFISIRYYLIGLFLFLLTILIPMNYYFFVGLCCGFFSNKLNPKINSCSIILSIFSVIVFVVLKMVRLYFIGGV